MKLEIMLAKMDYFALLLTNFIYEFYQSKLFYKNLSISVKRDNSITDIEIHDGHQDILFDFCVKRMSNELIYSFYISNDHPDIDYFIQALNHWKPRFLDFLEEAKKKVKFEVIIIERK